MTTPDYDDAEAERRIDLYHEGYFAHRDGKPRPSDEHAAAGWDDRKRDSLVRVVMPARPEGYYHAPVGTFD